jgi:MFS family permease
MANFTERLRYKKPFVAYFGGVGERLPYLLAGIAVWLWAETQPILALAALLLCLGVTAFAAGASMPAWFDLIAKVIPVQRRGLWSGLGHSLGAAMGMVGALLVGYVLANYPFPTNFGLLFVLAFAAMVISWIGLFLNREPPSPMTKAPVSTISFFRQLPAILQINANYRRFLLSRTTIQLGAMATGFFMVYGRSRFAIDGAGIGFLTMVLVGSMAVMNLVWGFLADRAGHKVVLTGSAVAMASAALVALLAPSPEWLAFTFILLGAYSAADSVSGLNIILEFCAPEDRPTYIGLTNTLLAPVIVLAPILGGTLATVAGYPGLLMVAMLIAGTGGLLMAFWVREPRRQPAQTRT